MTTTAEGTRQRVVKLVQELLLDEEDRSAITPAIIAGKIDLVLTINPRWGEGLDRNAVTDDLIRRFSLWIGQDATLKNHAGHEAWLSASRKKDWRYWQRYREWLERSLSYRAVDAIDKSTDAVLELLEDPTREGHWDRRGLVVGHVQSGKTANYTGLICKAADAGYKIIVVLAGLHNNLRSQTQMRLDEGFLGYETAPVPEDISIIGVGHIDGDPSIRPNYVTNRSDKGDFNTAVARNLGITPEQRPWLFVVKKNKTVLERLYRWLRNHVANAQDPKTGERVVTHLPLLLIDDEADHASVDTGEQPFDADGNPDEEHAPKAINSRVRKILRTFARSSYVGYTATPFANIFIHEKGVTREEGPDLFPEAFIINLAAPSNYVGPARLFGLLTPEGRRGGLPLVRRIEDHATSDGDGWMPEKHKNGHVPLHQGADALPPSLVEAIDAFLLSCAARRVRGQGTAHSSMLIHVTRFNSVQQEVHRQVAAHMRAMQQRLSRRIDHEAMLSRLNSLWHEDFVPTCGTVRAAEGEDGPSATPSWEEILVALPDVLPDVDVRMINGTAKDALDYAERDGTGLKVIAIGGDKLARGLTLEGLSVSYFLRASKMYDTLMQMGRWFGYRPGYLDLSRLYTTLELATWFGYITDAAEELREEFDLMAASGATPREYGLKVKSHSVLMVTSPLKMRAAKNLMLSFSGQLLETVSLYRESAQLTSNLDVASRLIEAMGNTYETDPVRSRVGGDDRWTGFLWSEVPAVDVIDFLSGYKTHPAAYKVNSAMLADFVRSMATAGELVHWTVALIGGGTGDEHAFSQAVRVRMNKRTGDPALHDRYSIGRLLDPKDEAIDLDAGAYEAALLTTRAARKADPARLRDSREPEIPNGPAIRKVRGFGTEGIPAHPEKAVLLLYALDPQKAGVDLPHGTPPIIAFGVSFPGSDSGLKVEYKVNNVLWKQEYGPSE
jgi:hypothetical protein